MIRNFSIVATSFAILALTTVTKGVVLQGPVVNPANGHSYDLISQDTWTNSEAAAVALGGHLASINDQAEQDWVYGMFPLPQQNLIWLGGRDQQIPSWIWVTGEPFGYTNWGSFPGGSEPDGNPAVGESYLAMFSPGSGSRSGTWADLYNTDGGFYGLVEIAPEPTSIMLLGIGGVALMVRRRKYA